jgi:methyltransferase (TIGR00027 family)
MRSWPSLTAEAVCLARALEDRGPPGRRLLADPFAHLFLRRPTRAAFGALGLADPVAGRAQRLLDPGLVTSIAARHAWIDERLLEALPQVDQILILGAGYDSRAWRHAGAIDQRLLVEIDHVATLTRKHRVARRNRLPAVQRQPADLADEPLEHVLDHSRLAAGAPTAVVWEGVTMYLERPDIAATLRALAAFVGPGSHVILDLWAESRHPLWSPAERVGRAGLAAIGEPILTTVTPQAAPALLHEGGWEVQASAGVREIARVRARRRAHPILHMVDAARS